MNIDTVLSPPGAVSKADMLAAFDRVTAVAELIRERGTVPSGELYARLVGHFTLASYEATIALLVRASLVSNTSHLLTWTGPSLT